MARHIWGRGSIPFYSITSSLRRYCRGVYTFQRAKSLNLTVITAGKVRVCCSVQRRRVEGMYGYSESPVRGPGSSLAQTRLKLGSSLISGSIFLYLARWSGMRNAPFGNIYTNQSRSKLNPNLVKLIHVCYIPCTEWPRGVKRRATDRRKDLT